MATGDGTSPQELDVTKLSRDFSEAVQQVKDIRLYVTALLDSLVVRKNEEPEKDLQAIKETMKQVHNMRSKLDALGSTYGKLRLNQLHTVPLGNTGYVSLDPGEEKSSFYQQLLTCYTWLKKVDEEATTALSQLQKSPSENEAASAKRLKLDSFNMKSIISQSKVDFPSLVFNESLVTSKSVLEVRIPGVVSVSIIFSGKILSQVVARSVVEDFQENMWKPSKHHVFQALTDQLTSVILKHFGEDPDKILRTFLRHLCMYENLFSAKCKFCGLQLHSDSEKAKLLPPLGRNIETKDVYHLSCH